MSNHGKKQIKASLEELTWQQVRDDVAKVNPKFVEVVDKVDPGKEYTIFKARYPYGAEILKHAVLYLPDEQGELVPITDSVVSQHIKESLGYNLESNPVSMVLQNSVELFLTLDDRTLPSIYGLITPGKIFGTWRVLNPQKALQSIFVWDMTAGARSLFMLPKISETERHKKLKRAFHLNADVPRTQMEHWSIFREIANHASFPNSWHTEILFFSKKWFEHLEDEAWMPFYYFLLRTVWQSTEFWRNQFFWDILFSTIQKSRNLKPSPYVADTVKYLFAIGVGSMPGFYPALDDISGPIAAFQQIYLNVYNLKQYAPTIMQPGIFSMQDEKCRPVYYSLQFPTAADFSPKSRDRSSIITDLFEIKSLLTKYIAEVLTDKYNLHGTPFYEFTKYGSFDFFHNNVEAYTGMRESSEIPFEDESFYYEKNANGYGFPETSPFVRGCIRIFKKGKP